MTPNNRLRILAILIVLSAAYAVIVKKDQGLAYAIALGYIAIMLTILIITQCFKKPSKPSREDCEEHYGE
jgi:ABC-type uncharacterized transport system permease subunit